MLPTYSKVKTKSKTSIGDSRVKTNDDFPNKILNIPFKQQKILLTVESGIKYG